jgi:hypothetical protein
MEFHTRGVSVSSMIDKEYPIIRVERVSDSLLITFFDTPINFLKCSYRTRLFSLTRI